MIVLITLTSAGLDTGPFDIYSNSTGSYVLAQSNISKSILLGGYSATVPDGTTSIRLKSAGDCTNHITIPVLLKP